MSALLFVLAYSGIPTASNFLPSTKPQTLANKTMTFIHNFKYLLCGERYMLCLARFICEKPREWKVGDGRIKGYNFVFEKWASLDIVYILHMQNSLQFPRKKGAISSQV